MAMLSATTNPEHIRAHHDLHHMTSIIQGSKMIHMPTLDFETTVYKWLEWDGDIGVQMGGCIISAEYFRDGLYQVTITYDKVAITMSHVTWYAMIDRYVDDFYRIFESQKPQ